MRTIKVELSVSDDWNPGSCDDCPLGYMESAYDEDDGYDYWYTCALGGHCGYCPLREYEDYESPIYISKRGEKDE